MLPQLLIISYLESCWLDDYETLRKNVKSSDSIDNSEQVTPKDF